MASIQYHVLAIYQYIIYIIVPIKWMEVRAKINAV